MRCAALKIEQTASIGALLLGLLATSCAKDLRSRGPEVQLGEIDGTTPNLLVPETTRLEPAVGKCKQALAARSEWRPVGTLAQGVVYRPLKALLTVDTGNDYEAWIVVHDSQVVALYLPVEKRIVELSSPAPLLEAER